MAQKVDTRIRGLSRSLSFSFTIPRKIEAKKISYSPKTSSNGIIKGNIIITHCKKQDAYKHGGTRISRKRKWSTV